MPYAAMSGHDWRSGVGFGGPSSVRCIGLGLALGLGRVSRLFQLFGLPQFFCKLKILMICMIYRRSRSRGPLRVVESFFSR